MKQKILQPTRPGTGPKVNLEWVVMLEKADYHTNDYRINFYTECEPVHAEAVSPRRHEQPRKMVWYYNTKAERDADYERCA